MTECGDVWAYKTSNNPVNEKHNLGTALLDFIVGRIVWMIFFKQKILDYCFLCSGKFVFILA